MKNTKEDFDKRIAVFMCLEKYNNYWSHPGESNTISQTLGFSHDWQWLMPVVEKIQRDYRFDVVLKEYDRTDGGYSSSITIFDYSWTHYYWANYERIQAEIKVQTDKAAKYGEVYKSEHHQIVESKLQAVYQCVCRFIEWWEKQNKL